MVLPEDKDVTLLIAEDVRQEIGNKLSINGWFTGDDIVFDRSGFGPGAVPGMPSLAIIFVVKSGSGKFPNKIQVTMPSGTVTLQAKGNDFNMNAGIPGAAIFKFAPFAASETGDYTVEWSLPGRSFRRSFKVR